MKRITGFYLTDKNNPKPRPYEAVVSDEDYEDYLQRRSLSTDNGLGLDMATLVEAEFITADPDINIETIDIKKVLTLIAKEANISDQKINEIFDNSLKAFVID